MTLFFIIPHGDTFALHEGDTRTGHPTIDDSVTPVLNLSNYELTFSFIQKVKNLDASDITILSGNLEYSLNLEGATVKKHRDNKSYTMTLKESHVAQILSWDTTTRSLSLAAWSVVDYKEKANSRQDIMFKMTGKYTSTLGSPPDLTAVPGNTIVTLSWGVPSNKTGLSIVDYLVEYRKVDGSWKTFDDGKSTLLSTTVSGLTNGVKYEFQVTAKHDYGEGHTSSIVKTTPFTVLGAPTQLSATPANNIVTLTWTAPNNNGAAITDYIIQYRKGTDSFTLFRDGISSNPSATVNRLTNGVSYDFRVAAVNSAGTGSYSTSVSATPVAPLSPVVNPPSAPTQLSATPANNIVTLTWTAPNNNGAAITDYIIQYRKGTDSFTQFNDGTSSNPSATVNRLTNGVSYDFRVAAVNSAGTGSTSEVISVIPNVPQRTVGVIVSTSGGIQSVGIPIDKTIDYAVDKFNQQLAAHDKDWRLKISKYNDGSAVDGAKLAMTSLNDAGIKSVIGPASSSTLNAVQEYVNKNDMLAISYGSTSPTLAKEDKIFRTVPDDTTTASIFAQIMQDDDLTHVIPVFRDDTWGLALSNTLKELLLETNITVGNDIKYSVKSIDYDYIISKIEQEIRLEKKTGVILFSFDEIVQIIDAAKTNEKLGDSRWYSVEFERNELLKDEQRKKFLTDVGYTTVTASVPSNNITKELDKNVDNTSVYAYAAYDAVFILGRAIDEVGTATDTMKLAETIPSVASRYMGAMGNTTLNSTGDLAYAFHDIRTMRSGMNDEITTCSPTKINGTVFNDVDGDGKKDSDERGIPAVLITADGHQAMTNSDGTYLITCLNSPEHNVAINVPSGYVLSPGTVKSKLVSASVGKPATVNFALQANSVTLNIMAFNDSNGDRKQNSGEKPISGITILTYTPNTNAINLLLTGEDGTISTMNLTPDPFYAIVLLDGKVVTTNPFELNGNTYNGILYVKNPSAGSTHNMKIGIQ